MNQLKTGIILVISLFLSNLGHADGIDFQSISLKEAVKKAKNEKKPIFIDIFATWCGPCKTLSKTTFKNEDLGEFMNEHFINLKLDGELPDGAQLMEKFELGAYPTMLFLSSELELLRMIEGAVSAETIQDDANAVVFPESTKIFKLTKRFQEGERDKIMLQELILESLYEEKEHDVYVEEYMRLFPGLDLDNSDEFIVFGAGTNDLENENIKLFLAKPAHFLELHEHLAQWKMTLILISIIDIAKEQTNGSLMKPLVDKVYPAYKIIQGEDGLEKSELLEAMNEALEET